MTKKPTGTMPSTRMTTGRRSPSQLPPPQLPRELPGRISHLAGCQRSHSQESRARGARRFSCGERAKRIQRVVKHQILLWRIRQRWRRVQPSQRNRRAKMQVPALASSRSTNPMSPKARRTIRSLRLPTRKKRIRKSRGLAPDGGDQQQGWQIIHVTRYLLVPRSGRLAHARPFLHGIGGPLYWTRTRGRGRRYRLR